MAQSKQPVPGTAGYSPQQGHAAGAGAPVDPRYQQAYPNQDPGVPVDPRALQAQQQPHTQPPPDSRYPQQQAQPGQYAPDSYNTQPAPGPAGVHPDGGPAQSAYAPQFAPYTQPQAAEPHQQPVAAPRQQQFEGVQQPVVNNPAFPNQQQAYSDPVGHYAQPQDPHAPYQGAPDHGHAPQPAPTYEEWPNTAPPQQDAHGYDVGGFQHADPHTGAPGNPPVYADDPSLQPYGELAAGGQVEPTYDDEEYDDHDEIDGSGGSRRIMMIVGALVGAIAVGGGLAYGYKAMTGSQDAKLGKTPVVRSAQKPSKARPSDPGGRQFDHTDSKIMGRLGQAGARAPASTDANGTRRVSTVIVGSDGKIQPPAVAPTPTGPAPANPVVSVPGLTVVDAFRGQPGTSPTGAITAATSQPLVVKPPAGSNTKRPRVQIRNAPKKPIVVSKANPSPPAVTKPKATAPAVRVPPVAKKKAPVKTATAPIASSSGTGFVAVLASVPVSKSSRMSALMQYADLQQKYASVLANKTPDVVEANLGAKGKYHRLLVGPPGSRQQASSLCSKLKSAGYSGCWVTSY